jgi:xanthine dehydrogenase large subunit
MRVLDSSLHVRGESLFVDDLPEPAGLLFAAAATSPVAHGRLLSFDCSAAAAAPGVVHVLTAESIPGINQVGGIIQDEQLMATDLVDFIGQPLALVVAETRAQARAAAELVKPEIEELEPVLDPRQAAAAGQLIAPSRTFTLGDIDAAWTECEVVVEGRVDSGPQEHVYLETQGTMAIPVEPGKLKLLSATQAPTVVQRIVARVLGLPMHSVEVEVKRLGGAFGGKEDQATVWAVMAGLAAYLSNRPVKIVLNRHEDLRLTGKRHPYSSDFKLGVSEDGKLLAYQVTLYQSSGAAADLSTAILERTLFHATNSYFIANVKVTAIPCRTNLPPFTAMRGFGAPQAMLVIESAIAAAAEQLGIAAWKLQEKNLLTEGNQLPYGMKVERSQARRSFDQVVEQYDLAGLVEEIEEHNADNRSCKRGLAVMPICFGISFTNTFLNQAGALVHVYTDGSVNINTGAVDMGQGVNAKMLAVAAHTLGIALDRIIISTTSTERVANTSPTAASSGADMNGKATEIACTAIVERLRGVAARLLQAEPDEVSFAESRIMVRGMATYLTWDQLVWQAYTERVNLSAQAHYATPDIYFDKSSETGKPFAYHVFGTGIVEVTVNGLLGTYTVDRVRVVHDAGRSLAPLIDRGQVEGGVVQGIGWMTMEELVYSDQGRLLTDTLSTYKVPDLHAAPEIETVFLADVDNPHAVLSSKAIGEPPFMYGIGAYFALMNAMKAFRPDKPCFFSSPMTPEKVLMYIYGDDS